jgi:hypothetical protein
VVVAKPGQADENGVGRFLWPQAANWHQNAM